jgi:hypothetical protein
MGLFVVAMVAACGDDSPVATPAVAAALTGRPTVDHFVSNGPHAEAYWYVTDAAGVVTYGYLSVSRGGPVNDPQTLLSYDVFQCGQPGPCNEIESGYGLIANGDFSASGKRMQLTTNTDDLNFGRFVGNGGSITVTWKSDGIFVYEQEGRELLVMPGDTLVPGSTRTTYRLQGSFSSTTANAGGNVFGQDLPPDSQGSIGTNHSVTIQITR